MSARDVIESVPGFGEGETSGDAIIAALTAAGYAVVPIVPTPEMLAAARNAGMPAVLIDSYSGRQNLELSTRYAAMITAATKESEG
jgi:hypothetical protein